MKAIFALFLIIAFLGMAFAGVHHYRVNKDGGEAKEIPAQKTSQSGTIFDAVASGINGLFG